MKSLIKFIDDNNLGDYKENVSFKTLTTYKTGGVARLVFFPNSVSSLKEVLSYLKDNNIDYKVFGNGSNILASDNTYDGVIIKLSNLNNLEINGLNVEVEAGYLFTVLCNKVAKLGLSGLEFGGGIPGTVGGVVYMNAGAYLEDISHVLEKVDILDENNEFRTVYKKDLDFGYRHSIFMSKNWIILKVYLKLSKGDIVYMSKLITERKERRSASQPLEYPSAGSVFRNPEGNYAGKLIEDSNLKGFIYGGAKISDKHANFIVNYDNASSNDILYLMKLATSVVKQNYNIDLYNEQELFNFGDIDE